MSEDIRMKESMNLTLLVEKKTRQIVYAEAGKDFVDLLFSFLVMPIGSIVKLLSSFRLKKVGSITNLYESMEKLPSVYMKSDKSVLLNPMIDSTFCHETLSIGYGESRYYVCGHNSNTYGSRTHNITNRTGQKCSCGQPLSYEVLFGGIDNSSNAVSTSTETRSSCDFVKETVTFMITDDLTISPSSTIACIALLNRMNINDFSQLEAKSVVVGSEQAVKLLWASLNSTSALNDVFSATISTTTEEGSRHVDIVEEMEGCKPFIFHSSRHVPIVEEDAG